jgi:hypothetical protein
VLSPASATEYTKFVTCTCLIFHNPVPKRAFGATRSWPSAAAGGCSQTASQFAPNARNVENFHCLIYHGSVGNSEVRVTTCLIFTGVLKIKRSGAFTRFCNGIHQVRDMHLLDFSRSRAETRVWRRASPAERRRRRLLANCFAVCAKRAERENFSPLGLLRDCAKFSSAGLQLA